MFGTEKLILKSIFQINFESQVIGLCRSLLALATFITLAVNGKNVMFPIMESPHRIISNSFLSEISLFNIFSEFNYFLPVGISLVILFLVIIGWKPRITCLFHWWITWSLVVSSPSIDGGDQLNAILTILLIPLCLADNRKWHFQVTERTRISPYLQIFLFSVFIMIRIQVSVVYLGAFVYKVGVPEWYNGTVLYYWFKNPYFGLNDFFQPISRLLFYNYLTTSLATWSVLLLEMILFAGLFMKNSYRKYLLAFGILFHFLTWVVHGLMTFFVVMTAALLLYLCPINKPIYPDLFTKFGKIVFQRK